MMADVIFTIQHAKRTLAELLNTILCAVVVLNVSISKIEMYFYLWAIAISFAMYKPSFTSNIYVTHKTIEKERPSDYISHTILSSHIFSFIQTPYNI